MMLSWCSHRGICCHPVPVGRESFGCIFLPRQWRFLSPLQRFLARSPSNQPIRPLPEALFSVVASIPIPIELLENWKLNSANFRLLPDSERYYRGNPLFRLTILGIIWWLFNLIRCTLLSPFSSLTAPPLSGYVHFLCYDIESLDSESKACTIFHVFYIVNPSH